MKKQKIDNNVQITDDLTIDMDFLPIDIIMSFMNIYYQYIQGKEKELFDNAVWTAMRMTPILSKSSLLEEVIKWADPTGNVDEIKKQVKSKNEINLYLQLFARIEDYLSVVNA